MPAEGIFFDLGGTLFSYRNVARTNIPLLVEGAARMGVQVSEAEIRTAYARASRTVSHAYADKPYYLHRDMFSDMFKAFSDLIGGRRDQAVYDWYLNTHQRALVDCLEIKADCVETLAALKRRGLYLSIVSNIDDDMLDPLVAREQLHDYLDHWTSSEAAGSCKPHQRFFEVAVEKSGLNPAKVLFVGDSPEHDVIGANAIGMRTVLIVEDGIEPPMQTGRDAIDPDHTIRELRELTALIAR
ncbi:MAG: HAD family hydrolase [Gammaproteobacteria bacterium]|jgi:2-haloalkanoic acid dehalogenase type II